MAFAFCSTVNAEIKRFKVVIDGVSKVWTTQNNRQRTEYSNARNLYASEFSKPVLLESIQVEFGEKLELIDASAQFNGTGGNERVFLDVLVPEFNESFEHSIHFSVVEEKTKYGGHLGEGSGSNVVFYGPCTIRLGLVPRNAITYERGSNDIHHYGYIRNKSVASATFKISAIDDSGSAGRGSNYSLVIPEASGDATLVLESSDDLVSWEADTVGDKPKGNRKKFYRLRAKKN
jgi:hypothetical protein